MQRDRIALAGEQRNLGGWFPQVQLQASHTRYQHEEVGGTGDVGTTFSSRGNEVRLQAHHAALGPLQGVIGLQSETLQFSALGEEAFVPGTHTRSNALFVVEELKAGAVTFSGGLCGERTRVSSDGDAADATTPRFGSNSTAAGVLPPRRGRSI